ncbi:uncharacterized protein IUM83_14323 [Phytophthora cinnamomi]|uniref:uncharacterized protein n=1 Tax=Phytophthora cinnamomi TaxID=4785 RepID=UPI00355A4AE4|nr:hypothetical protein IUM83_14323 [Phytophthora cinnamomi]
MAGPAAKKASDSAAAAAAAAAAAEAALAAEALEREAAAAGAASKAQQEAEQEAARRQQQEQDELDVVAVGAVAHVIRRAFHSFYAATEAPEAAEPSDAAAAAEEEAGDADAAAQSATSRQDRSTEEAALEAAAASSARDVSLPQLELEPSPFVALAQTRKDAIARELKLKHERARALLRFMQERRQQAAEADARIAEQLSDKGLVVKAQIPVGPTHLRLDDQELRAATDAGDDFGEFADSLLHAKSLVAEYEQSRRERSGNGKKAMTSPTRRTAAGEQSGENGEQLGYLDSTMSASIRTEATLEQHRNHIAEVKMAHEEHRAAASSGKVSPLRAGTNQSGDNVPDLIATTLTPLSTTQLEHQQLKASKSVMNPVEKRKNMAILERMQTKLDFVRNPRYAAPDQGKLQLDEYPTESNGTVKPCFDIVPKPPIMFSDYDIGGIYEQVVYVRNTGMLSRRARILPPGTIFFSMASVLFPEESGMVAPGMHVEVRVRFAPDSRADYKDNFTVQYETEQPLVPGSAEYTGGWALCYVFDL